MAPDVQQQGRGPDERAVGAGEEGSQHVQPIGAVDGEEEVEQEGLPGAEADRREARPLDAEAPA